MVLPLLAAAAGRIGASAIGGGLLKSISSLFGESQEQQSSGSGAVQLPTLEPSPTPNLVPVQTVNQAPSALTSAQPIPVTQSSDRKLDYLIQITDNLRSRINLMQSQIKSINSTLVSVGRNVQSSALQQQSGSSPIRSALKVATQSFIGSGLTAAGLGAFAAFLNAPDKPVSQQIDDIKQGNVSPEVLTTQIDNELGIQQPAVNLAAGQQVPSQQRLEASKKTIDQAIKDSPKIKEIVQELEKSGVQVDKTRNVTALSDYVTRLAFKGQEQPGPQPGAVNYGAGQQLPIQQQPVRNLRFIERQMETPTLVPSDKQGKILDPDKHGPVIETARTEQVQQQKAAGLQINESLEALKTAFTGPTVTESPSIKSSTQSIADNSSGQMSPTIVQPIINNNYSGGSSGPQVVNQGGGSGGSVRVAYNTPADFKSYSPSLSGVI